MAQSSDTLVGPDLKVGIPPEELRDDAPLLGHAEGEAVLLVRSGGELYGVGAHCTHYSGSLADGLVVRDGPEPTLRCPLHHACFRLRDGAAMRAPAHGPIAAYEIKQEGGLLRVAGKKARMPEAPLKAEPRHITVVGAGAAGFAAVETLRQRGYRGTLTWIGADSSPPYDRPNLSKDYLAGKAPEDWIPLKPPQHYLDEKVDLRLGARVQQLNLKERKITLASQQTFSFETLLLCTGAEPIRLTLPGAGLPHVHTLRSLEQCRSIIAAAERCKRVVLLGASFIAMEVAAALRHRKLEVHVVAPPHAPLPALGAELGGHMQRLHERHGVVFHMGQAATRIDAERVVLEDGNTIPCDMVVLGVGVRPAVDVAQSAGLEVNDGIVVNQYLQTSAPGIYAAGDNCRWPDPYSKSMVRIEHWVLAQRLGQIAAHNILGDPTPVDPVPFFWTTQYDTTICYVGHAPTWDRISEHGKWRSGQGMLAYWQGSRVAAVACLGFQPAMLQCELSMERGESLEELLKRFD